MLSLLMGMVCSVGWAQPTVSPAPSDGQWAEGTTWYQIKTKSGYYLRGDNLDSGGYVQMPSSSGLNDAALWCIVGDAENGFAFYNKAIGAETPMCMNNSNNYAQFVAMGSDGYTSTFDFVSSQKSDANTTYWCVRKHTGADNNFYWNPQGDPKKLTYWNSSSATNDNGSAFLFTEYKQPDVTTFSTEDAPRWYSVEFKTGGNFLTDAGSGNNMVTVGAADSNEECWMFIGDYFGFKMKSGNGNYVYYDETASRFRTTNDAAAATTLTFVPGAAADTWELQRSGSSKCMNQNGGTGVGVQLGEWTAGDANNPFYLNATVLSNVAPVFTDGSTDWFMIRFANGGNHLSSNGADGQAVTAAIRNVASQWWKFVGTAENFQLVSKDGRYATIKSGTATNGQTGNLLYLSDTEDASGFSIVETSNATYAGAYEIVWNGSTGNSFNQWGGASAGMSIGLWTKGSNGNPLYLYVPGEDLIATFDVEGISGYTPASPLTLWYTNAASNMNVSDQWMEYSLPIGNGQFGASIFGGVAREEVQFNEKTLWSGTKNDNSSEYGDYENFGSLYIDDISGVFGEDKAVKDYYRQLDLSNATASVHYKSTDGTINFTREYIASNPDQVVAMRLTADQAGQISIRVTMESGRPGVRATTSYAEGTAHFAGKLETVSYDALAKVVPTGGTMTTDANGITVTGADEVLIILGGATDFDAYNAEYVSGTANLSTLVQDRVNDAAEKTWRTLYSTHLTDYKSFFDRCNFVLDGAANTMPTDDLVRQYQNRTTGTEDYALMLEQLYFAYGRYLEIGSSRGVDLPSNLQGIWNNSSEPAWNADIHANINVQMNYWPAEPTNLSEMHMPFLNYIINMANSAEWKALAQKKGSTRPEAWTFLTENNIFGGFGSFAQNAVINNAWYVSHLWQHYRYTLDQAFLEKAFPAMWGASMFWMDRLELNEEDGTYECPDEYSPEHGPGAENATAHSQQLVWELFDNTLKAVEILGESKVNAEDLATLRDRFSKLDKGLATEVYDGQWGTDRIASGTNILREWKTSNYTAGQDGHRHMSHLMCLYPFNQIAEGTDLFNAAINSMLLRGDASTGWSMGWKINLWARALDGDHSHDILELALRHHSVSGGGVYYNLYDSHAPFQIDGNFGACAGIAEMLMQSHTDVIQILPALPSVWENGRITGLKAVGNFTVDIEWANSEAQTATIVSHAGTELRVSCNRGDIATAIITVDGVNTAVTVENGIATIPCTQGQTVVIDFTEVIDPNAKPVDGYYIMYSESSSGKGWVHYNGSLDRKYRVATDVDLSTEVTTEQAQYIWKLVNDSENGTFTLWNLGGNVYMPADASRNVNMGATTPANLAIEAVGGEGNEGKWFVSQTNYTNNGNTLYIHTNTPGGYPNLSYWDAKSVDGTSIRAMFTKVNLPETTYTINYMCGEEKIASAEVSYPTGLAVPDMLLQQDVPAGYLVQGNSTLSGNTYTINVVSDIFPEAGDYIRIGYDFGGTAGVKYLQSTNSSVKGLAMTADKGEGSIFLVEEVDGNLRLKSITTGKYLKEEGNSRGLYDTGGNVTFTVGTDGRIKIQAPSYLHPNSSGENYFMDHCGNDGCAQHNLIVEEVEVRSLEVEGPAYVGASATWNGETKALPATWTIFDGITISNPTLSINCPESYSFINLTEEGNALGQTVEIASLTANRTITANFNIAFFSASTAENDLVPVRIRNVRDGEYTLRLNANDNYTGKAVNSGVTAYGENEIWYLVGTEESFKIYNRVAGTGLHMVLAGTVGGSAASMNTTDTNADFCLVVKDNGYAITPKAKKDQSINMHGGAGQDIKLYGATDGGSIWVVEKMDVDNPITLNVEVDQVWESSPRVAELTLTIDGLAGQTRILGSVEGQKLYIPLGATYEVSSMTYRGYTYNGCENNDGVLTASYTANNERTLYYSPDANGKPYRIPAIATAANGHIFAIADNRPSGADIGYGEVDIKCRISTDNGVTWGEEFFLANGDGSITTNNMKYGYGDAAVVADRESNKLLAMMVAGHTVCHNGRWDTSKIGDPDAEAVNRVARVYATFNETTQQWEWTEPEEVTDAMYSLFLDGETPTVTSMFIGSGKICQSRVVKKGEYYRLYCSIWTRDNGNRVIYSDDFGGTWNVLGTIADRPAPNGDEPKCEELPDGSVILSSRVSGGRWFNIFTFNNEGKSDAEKYTTGSWGSAVKSTSAYDGSGNGTNGEIYKVKAIRKDDGLICDVMLQSIPAGPGRTNVKVYYKEMEYNTDGTNKYTPATFAEGWQVGKHVSFTDACYSTMILQADGRIGFLMEEVPGGYCIVYIPYTLEDLTANKYSLYTVNSTISSHGIGTFYASEAMQIPEGVKAYAAVEIPVIDAETKIGTLSLNQLTGFIPAKTGAVILGGADTYTFMPSISYGTAVEDNLLVGFEADDSSSDSYAAVTLPTDGSVDYVLSVKNDLAAFYRKAADFKVYNNKAYLQVPATTATALRLRFVDADGTTSIRDVMTEIGAADAVYDLQGRRVRQAGKGVYIVNGKKVLR